MVYTFDFTDAGGRIDHFDMVLCSDDDDAIEAGQKALDRSSTSIGLTIWDGSRQVAEVHRSTRSPKPRDLSFRMSEVVVRQLR